MRACCIGPLSTPSQAPSRKAKTFRSKGEYEDVKKFFRSPATTSMEQKKKTQTEHAPHVEGHHLN